MRVPLNQSGSWEALTVVAGELLCDLSDHLDVAIDYSELRLKVRAGNVRVTLGPRTFR